MKKNILGNTGLSVSSVCVGTSALGGFPEQYGYDVDEATAISTISRVFEGPFNFLDTSNEYGGGDSEKRIGRAIKEHGGLPQGFLLATKVDPLPGTNDFSGDRVRRSVEESIARLGMDHLPLVYFHDPEKISFEQAMASSGPVNALIDLQEQGVIGALGVAGGPIDLELQYLRTEVFDVILSHNRFTLVDQSAAPLMEEASQRGVGFVNAAPFGGGMLSRGPSEVPTYCYAPVPSSVLNRVHNIEAICARHNVPLAAVALQFSLNDPRISSTIVGMSAPKRVAQTEALSKIPIPHELWAELLPLIAHGRDGVLSPISIA